MKSAKKFPIPESYLHLLPFQYISPLQDYGPFIVATTQQKLQNSNTLGNLITMETTKSPHSI